MTVAVVARLHESTEVPCVSLDCPVLYARKRAGLAVLEAAAMRSALGL